ncbi:MAG TPA: thioredoxin family protein [Anaerolineales bacterium]|nr:thioredoxin family protein [Anaerolineales bacterium]
MAELLNDDVKSQIREVFEQLKEPVQVLFFGRTTDCEYCEDTRQLVEEVTALSDQLTLAVHDLDQDADIASQYRVDKTPGLVVAGLDGDQVIDYGIRYSGIPSGHEFTSLIHDLVLVSSRDSGLRENTRQLLSKLSTPIHLQVFVTPT